MREGVVDTLALYSVSELLYLKAHINTLIVEKIKKSNTKELIKQVVNNLEKK